jgi:predicted nucleic-acid-binding Zn-ribbon protein
MTFPHLSSFEVLYLEMRYLDSGRIMSEAKKCPKCGGEMEAGRSLIATHAHFWEVLLSKKGDWYGDKVIPFFCKNCGFIEIYKEMKEKRD